ncbi:MAG TPA: DUF302 domain-containing protein [Gammaproteobacteria bacterium]|nr:DUF302 domain-containing protein [Gammaproteobacteria bacterium]
MNLLRNIFAVFGLLFMVTILVIVLWAEPGLLRIGELDEGALRTYSRMAHTLLETGSAAEATVVKVKVKEGLTAEEVEDAMLSVATEHNIRDVGKLPLYKQVAAMTGKPYRFMKIYMFCNPLTAARMLDYNDAFSAYLPCRVALVESKTGELWLYTLDMDLMIHGGHPLPEDLKTEALRVQTVINDIMQRGAAGEF